MVRNGRRSDRTTNDDVENRRRSRCCTKRDPAAVARSEVSQAREAAIDVDVTTDPGCTWTATSTVTWVTVVEGATGPGKGKVRLLVQANDGPARSVVLTIAGQPFALRQDAAR